jgi:hypothetical protein
VGFALTVASITAVAAQLPIGFLVDKVGSRLMLVLGLALSAAAFIPQCPPARSRAQLTAAIVYQVLSTQRLGKNAVGLKECRASFEDSLREAPQDEAFFFMASTTYPHTERFYS